VLASAGDTLGFDYLAYDAAARRLLAGQALYDTSFTGAGSFGLFYYPPTFAPLVLPFALVPVHWAFAGWTALLVAAFVAGVAAMPVARSIRWATLLLGGLMWPLLYAFKLGQVGPILFLLFALGWRWLAQDAAVGVTAGLGAAIKIQPGLILFWALLERRGRTLAAGVVVLAILALLVTLAGGPGVWADFLDLLRRVTDPVTTAHNFTPGALAWRLGASAALASAVQLATIALSVAAVVIAALRLPADRAYLVAVVASQLASPILWDHYALLLLLPVAFGLNRRQWWLAAVPLGLSLPLVGITPDVAYPLAFGACLVALFATRERQTALVTSPALG
jgi:hypothetical protein